MAWQTWMNSSSRCGSREIVLVAVLGDRHAADQFHDEVRTACFGRAGVEDLGDVGMIHHGQRLAFRLEAGDDLFGVHAQLDDLERHAAADGLLLLGHVNGAATAFADFLQQLVAIDVIASLLGERLDHLPVRRGRRLDGHIRIERGVRLQQGFDTLAQGFIIAAFAIKPRGALRSGLRQRQRKQRFFASRVHGCWRVVLSLASAALISAHDSARQR